MSELKLMIYTENGEIWDDASGNIDFQVNPSWNDITAAPSDVTNKKNKKRKLMSIQNSYDLPTIHVSSTLKMIGFVCCVLLL